MSEIKEYRELFKKKAKVMYEGCFLCSSDECLIANNAGVLCPLPLFVHMSAIERCSHVCMTGLKRFKFKREE